MDDTPVKMQTGAKTGKAHTARLWSYVRDERPWCGHVALRRRIGSGLRFTASGNVVVFPELGLAFNRVKKNANTLVTMLLRELSGKNVVHRYYAKWEALRPFDLPLKDLKTLQTVSLVVVVRNPYSCVLSAFLDKFREEKYRARYGEFARTPEGFATFVHWLHAGNMSRDAHWDLQCKRILAPLDRFDAVLRFETLAHDLEIALAAAGVAFDGQNLRAAYPSDEGKRTGAANKLAEFYSSDLIGIVSQLYARDFSALGYSTDCPGLVA